MRKGKGMEMLATAAKSRWFLSRRRAMLDYSDEEPEVEWVRRRNPAGRVSSVGRAPALGVANRSIFKLKERSVAPVDKLPASEAFFVDELATVEAGIPGQLQTFKSEETPKKGKFSISGQNPSRRVSLSEGDEKIFSRAAIDDLPPEYQHPDSFFKSMKPLVFWAQFLGVFPVSGFTGPNYKSLKFKWLHYKVVYWALASVGSLFGAVCSVIYAFHDGNFAQSAGGIGFFFCGIVSSLLMLNLAKNWRKVNKEFGRAEMKLTKYGYPKGIRLRFSLFTALALLLALTEHLLSKTKNVGVAVECARRKDDFFDLAESFFVHEYVEVFHIYSYSLWKATLILILHFLAMVNWNVKDLFLCLISWSIAERFKQVRDILDQVHGEERPISFWKEVRENYNNVSLLTKRIDNHVQKLMFLSIGSNLFFICIQLLNTLKKKIVSFKLFYFFWSFGFLVLRTGFVAFSAARINDESKAPKSVLYSVPQTSYSGEVRRFLTQLTTNDVALTGSGFFSVTRSLILTITGTVITYEIVLVQFSGNETENEGKTNRTTCLI